MDVPVNVPVDDPNADTEWNDILRKHGIIPEKPPSPTPIIEEALVEAQRLAHENRLEGKDLDELAELEDEEDEAFLNEYRKRRLAELSQISSSSVYNQVYPLQKPDYAREVTEASKKSYVLVLLTSSQGGNVESKLLAQLWPELARRFGEVKFCQIQADMCIEGYPEKNTPTILVYRDGDIKRQIITLKELGGPRTSVSDLERVLVEVGALQQTDVRLQSKTDEAYDQTNRSRSIKQGLGRRAGADEDENDSDWD